jgi:hypothetical protein
MIRAAVCKLIVVTCKLQVAMCDLPNGRYNLHCSLVMTGSYSQRYRLLFTRHKLQFVKNGNWNKKFSQDKVSQRQRKDLSQKLLMGASYCTLLL